MSSSIALISETIGWNFLTLRVLGSPKSFLNMGTNNEGAGLEFWFLRKFVNCCVKTFLFYHFALGVTGSFRWGGKNDALRCLTHPTLDVYGDWIGGDGFLWGFFGFGGEGSEIKALGAGVTGDTGGERGLFCKFDFGVERSEISRVSNAVRHSIACVCDRARRIFNIIPDEASIGALGQFDVDAVMLRVLEQDLPRLGGHDRRRNP